MSVYSQKRKVTEFGLDQQSPAVTFQMHLVTHKERAL